MVLDYLRKIYGTKIPILSDKKIADILETKPRSGTNFLGVPKMNKYLVRVNPTIEFTSSEGCKWDEICKENEKGMPVIAKIWVTDKHGHEFGHAVIIIDVDASKGQISYIDPALGTIIDDDIGTFISKWDNDCTYKELVKVKVGKVIQRKMPDYDGETYEVKQDE